MQPVLISNHKKWNVTRNIKQLVNQNLDFNDFNKTCASLGIPGLNYVKEKYIKRR